MNVVTILMMSVKLASPVLLKLKEFQTKCYDVIILDYDVTNNILSRDLKLCCRCEHVSKGW